MGVTCVYPWPLASGKNGQQVVDILQKNVELAGAQWSNSWCVDCETYQSAASMGSPPKILHIIHNTEYPLSTFACLENGSCLIADRGFDNVMLKIKGCYEPRKGAKIEAKGQRYELGDFVIKIGQVTVGVSFKGILIEVEYLPCLVASQCWSLLQEFLEGITGIAVAMPSLPAKKSESKFKPSDTIMQYLEQFNKWKKTSST
ncbi:mediator of RNA polymerase II transcription subunit 20-like [Dendronephthya gigantea]|uniref:mediator of RNA polymerase II transcription subunit 20-like n=1 Tax=Dendronephthya gigantea TaxID=151771 RepID=UPI001069B42E|nr:mediator of RNA polymerase II transcription subunit 20-like [Dendronephthya gigantea]